MKFRVWCKKFNRFLHKRDDWFLDFDGNLYYEDMLDNELVRAEKSHYVIQRFTGLYDINNKELWEGDLVLFPGESESLEISYRFGRWIGGDILNLSDYYTDSTEIGDICNVVKTGQLYEKKNS